MARTDNFNAKPVGVLKGANFNVTTDQIVKMNAGTYIIRKIVVTNASVSLTTAAGGFYPAASKGGTAIVAATQVYTANTAAGKITSCTLTAINNTDVQGGNIYFALTTAQGVAATADIYVYADIIS